MMVGCLDEPHPPQIRLKKRGDLPRREALTAAPPGITDGTERLLARSGWKRYRNWSSRLKTVKTKPDRCRERRGESGVVITFECCNIATKTIRNQEMEISGHMTTLFVLELACLHPRGLFLTCSRFPFHRLHHLFNGRSGRIRTA